MHQSFVTMHSHPWGIVGTWLFFQQILALRGQTVGKISAIGQTPVLLQFSLFCHKNKPEDHWSCIAHLTAEDMLKSAVTEEKTFKHSPWAGADNPLGPKFWCQPVGLITNGHLLQVYKESLQPLTLYTSFHDLINVYSHRSGADNPRGQNFDVNRNLLSLQSFATSFKKISLKSDFILFFSWFYTCIYM